MRLLGVVIYLNYLSEPKYLYIYTIVILTRMSQTKCKYDAWADLRAEGGFNFDGPIELNSTIGMSQL